MGSDSANRFAISDCFASSGQSKEEQIDLVSQTYSMAMPFDSSREAPKSQFSSHFSDQFGRRILPEIYPSFDPQRVLNRNGSEITFDEFNRVTAMKDAANRNFEFHYDGNGELNQVKNEYGSWHRQRHSNEWRSDNGSKWRGEIKVDAHGYSYTNFDPVRGRGDRTTYRPDGSKTVEYLGENQQVFSRRKEDKNGNTLGGDTVDDNAKATVQFKVEKGETKAGILNTYGTEAEIVRGKDDVHAIIHSKPDSAVRAMQEGRVVYTFNHNDKNNGARYSQFSLGATDRAMLDRYRTINPEQDLVVMACYDKQARGMRYQIYGGLDLASTKTGDTIKAGEVLGRAGDHGYTYAARRQKLTGKSVELMIQGQKI
ncbi:hypothetical protein KBI23_25235 [bacterium]|nr:hypothetical protein [bacterium]MBP9810825.1 hypothetical protein [bacterium]